MIAQYITIWYLTGYVVSLLFFITLDFVLKKHPDENGCTSIQEAIDFKLNENKDEEYPTSEAIGYSIVIIVGMTIWPLLLIALIWIFTWLWK